MAKRSHARQHVAVISDPERLGTWYAAALAPDDGVRVDTYRILRFVDFHLMIGQRSDVGDTNSEPGRLSFIVLDDIIRDSLDPRLR